MIKQILKACYKVIAFFGFILLIVVGMIYLWSSFVTWY